MRRFVYTLVTIAVTVPVIQNAWAKDKFELVEERIRTLAPSAQTVAVSETPMNGILQVQVGGEIVYATEDGKYLLQGRVIDMDTREDLTEISKAQIRKDILHNVDAAQQITFAPNHPVHDLTVFTDIDCGYCRKLHSQIAEYNAQGIAVHYMAFPRAGIGSPSYDKAVSVWCAKDQKEALTSAKAGNDPKPLQCDNPVDEQYQMGLELGVSGTPALLTEDGRLIPGYVPPETLRQRLDQMAAATAAAR